MPELKLTKWHLKVLKLAERYHACPPTYPVLIKQYWKRSLLLLTGSALGLYPLYALTSADKLYMWYSGLITGVCITAASRDLGTLRRVIRTLPLSNEITNWDRVVELIEECETNVSLI